jgi:hypothetical protein
MKKNKRPSVSKPTGAPRGRKRDLPQPGAANQTGPSPTAVAAEAIRTGVVPLAAGRTPPEEIPQEDEIQAGDPDVSPLTASYVGDEGPGGDMPTPDQNRVDDIGRALGVAEADSGALRTSSELLDRRDERRSDLEPADKPTPER